MVTSQADLIIDAAGLAKSFRTRGGGVTELLSDASLQVAPWTTVAVTGRSGVGTTISASGSLGAAEAPTASSSRIAAPNFAMPLQRKSLQIFASAGVRQTLSSSHPGPQCRGHD